MEVINYEKRFKNKSPIGSAINNELLNQLGAYSKESGIPISKLLDRAIKIYLESVRKQQDFILFYKEFSTAHVLFIQSKFSVS